MGKQLGFFFDQSKCVGCMACQIACKDRSDLAVGQDWRRIIQYGGGSWRKEGEIHVPEGLFAYYTSLSCNHCDDPACMDACPAAAISKNEDGVVLIDQDKCIGCRYCEWACPYGAPQFDQQKSVMSKCDFCYDRIQDGQNPACVDACPMRALYWGPIDELREEYGNAVEIEPLPVASITNPNLVIKPHRDAQVTGKGTGRIMNSEGE